MRKHRWSPGGRGCTLETHQAPSEHRENFHEPEAFVRQSTTRQRLAGNVPRTHKRVRALSALLMFAAFGCWIAAIVELPEHVMHAVLWIVAGAVMWIVGEATS